MRLDTLEENMRTSRETRLRARIDVLTEQRDELAGRVTVLEERLARKQSQLGNARTAWRSWRTRARAAEWGLRQR